MSVGAAPGFLLAEAPRGGHCVPVGVFAILNARLRAEVSNAWATGDEPMTGPQRSYLNPVAQAAGRNLPDDLTKAQASELIDELQRQTGRGAG